MTTSGFQAFLACDLWDLVDEGTDEVLDRVKGEAGVTGITTTVFSPATEEFRIHPCVSPRVFRASIGLHFQPDPSVYQATRIKPAVSDWLRSRDPLAKLTEACDRHGLNWRARLIFSEGEGFTAKQVDCQPKDAFGEAYPGHVCPSHPDVREFWRAMIQDVVARYSPRAVELVDLAYPGLFYSVDSLAESSILGMVGGGLANLCFCESCRQAAMQAGVDAAAAARSAQVTLEKILKSEKAPQQTFAEFLNRDAVLAAYCEWRTNHLWSFVQQLREACPVRFAITPTWDLRLAGAEGRERAEPVDAILAMLLIDDEAPDVEDQLNRHLALAGDATRLDIRLMVCEPFCSQAALLVRAAGHAAARGVRTLVFDSYDRIPLGRLDWIKQAVRFAAREAE